MKVLITGCSGFIGFHISKMLLEKKIKIFGIDSMNEYYNLKLKKKRLSILKKFNNFKFLKIDISNLPNVNSLNFKKIDLIINLAAQPGVRYSIINPNSYVKNNILGFANILEMARINKIPVIYSSSSSVYGDSKMFPVKENHPLKPKNIYALTKKNNEELAKHYCENFKVKALGLRFFTVFGEWGRPDMLILKFLISKLNNHKFEVSNNGNHYRDFTYIKDLCKMIYPIIKKYKSINNKNVILNICTGKSVHLKYVLKKLQILSKFEKLIYKKKNNLESVKTHGCNKKLQKYIKKKIYFTNIDFAINNTFDWFEKNKKIFLDKL